MLFMVTCRQNISSASEVVKLRISLLWVSRMLVTQASRNCPKYCDVCMTYYGEI